jgi:hypothetical protein
MLQQAGEIQTDGAEPRPVYECPECIVEGELFGEKFEAALTFWLDEQGQPQYPPANL